MKSIAIIGALLFLLLGTGCTTWGRGVYKNCDQVVNVNAKEWACDKPFWSR